MEPIRKGKQTNKTSNTCAGDKGKQTNKQAEAACVEVWMQGAVWSCVTCGVQYAMCQSMRKSFGDASEMCWKSAEFDTQGHTLTPTLELNTNCQVQTKIFSTRDFTSICITQGSRTGEV